MTETLQALAALLTRARRRYLIQLILDQAGFALGAAFAGSILLLLVGTQILDWYWLVLLFAATFAFGVWRTARLLPSRYGLAQIIDQRLGLHDTLSTAFIYASGGRRGPESLLEYEQRQAEAMARQVDPRVVCPIRLPKALYAVGGVALVAFGMFAIRYGVTHSLDLKPSLVKIAFESVWTAGKDVPEEKKSALQRKIEEQLKKLGIDLGGPEKEKLLDGAPENALSTVDTPNVNNAEAGDNDQRAANMKQEQTEPSDAQGTDKGEGMSGKEEQNAGDQKPEGASNAASKQDGNDKNGANQASEKNSLMDRMKDAMANLLNKLNMKPQGGQQQSAQNSKSGQQKQQQAQGQKGSQAQSKSDGNSQQSAEQQGQQQGEGQQSQTAQGKSGDKGAEKQASNDSKSGMGKDDGDKSAREAEQLAAMGKLSELLGKRSQNLTGELMVEVAGGNQQLKTAYSGKNGAHTEAGGEITRDEVPMAYRDFVQSYFDQVRKAPVPAPAAKKTSEASVDQPAKKPTKVTE